jgi:hypothetical protein
MVAAAIIGDVGAIDSLVSIDFHVLSSSVVRLRIIVGAAVPSTSRVEFIAVLISYLAARLSTAILTAFLKARVEIATDEAFIKLCAANVLHTI